ncbi:T9SS type A sorting domain-containing protein [uncultured Cytophaga sp.]|uniref:T9SS type A sorting domain-containing protein n=1 Tax=uncultured Cytophaga sp. TaxID=160238 RepID=UPI0026115E6F|nr:T9SS type A sorting domain-containing protein [uncultured Cytophaga sp.]
MKSQPVKILFSIFVFTVFSLSISAQQVTTFAGSTLGYADGTGTDAQFKYPKGVTVDPDGNLYVADTFGHRIRKITPAGVVTTIAGSGVAGNIDGTGTAASFSFPSAITRSSSGDFYVTDVGNNKIRKVTPAGVVTSVAGGDPLGAYIDGVGSVARFSQPAGLTFDDAGNLYVTDYGNRVIRKITADGTVSTFAGTGVAGYKDGAANIAQFDLPAGITRDVLGNFYVADFANNKIRKITPSGLVSTVAGSTKGYTDGSGSNVQFGNPTGVACDNLGNIYVADNVNNRIRKIDALGVVTTFAGSNNLQMSKDGYGTAADFYNPTGICFDPHGYLYVADENNNRIRRITAPTAGLPPVSTGIANTQSNVYLSVYPNPSSTFVHVECSFAITSIDVKDVTGNKVLSAILETGNTSMDVSSLSKGIYFFHITFLDGYKVVTFVKD